MRDSPLILVLNAGSSTLKYAMFEGTNRIATDAVEVHDDYHAVVNQLVAKFSGTTIHAVGHRVVHGGERFASPTKITPEILSEIEVHAPLAPLHIPAAVAGIRAIQKAWPHLPQVACFDTAFHATLPQLEQMFGLPRRLFREGIRRYGFHGLSYESIAGQLPRVSERAALGRTVVCHLGNGASLCGMDAGRSRTTTMGFTPLDGLLMATRPGRLDPGVVLYLLRNGYSVDAVERVLEQESGLLGVSGISSDLRKLLASPDPAASEAVELFCRFVAKEIAAAATVLGGLDAVVFTAGIGEHAATIRSNVCQQLGWVDVTLDEGLNRQGGERLHADGSRVEIFRLATDEESVIARHTANTMGVTT